MVQHKMAGMEPAQGLHIAPGQVQNLLLQLQNMGWGGEGDWLVIAKWPPVLPAFVLRTAGQQTLDRHLKEMTLEASASGLQEAMSR